MNKKGISPLIATVLLIGFTIVLAALVFRWGGQFFQGTTTETNQEIEEVMVLTGVDIEIKAAKAINPSTGCDGLELLIENKVEIPIDGFVIRVITDQETKSGTITEGLGEFSSKWFDVNVICLGKIKRIELFPKVLVDGKVLIPTSPSASFTNEIEEKGAYNPLPPSGLISYWSLDIDAGDEGGINNNDGTINGAVSAQGISGNALNFDGINDYTDFGNDNSLNLTETFTVSLWFKPTETINSSLSKNRGLFSQNTGGTSGGWSTYFGLSQGSLRMGIAGSSIPTNKNSWSQDEWHNLVMIYNAPNVTFYVNGVKDSESTVGYISQPIIHPFAIGYNKLIAYNYFNGIIDEVAIWGRILQENEIQDYYDNLEQQIEEQPLTFLHFTDSHIIIAGLCGNSVAGDGRTDCENFLTNYVSECSTGVCQWINSTSGTSLSSIIALQDAIQEAQNLDYDFAVFTGDNVANPDCNQNTSFNAFKSIADGLGTVGLDYYLIGAHWHDNIDDPICKLIYESIFGSDMLNWNFVKGNNLFVGLSEISEGTSGSRYNETYLTEVLTTYQDQDKKLFLSHHIGTHCTDEYLNTSSAGFRCTEDEIETILQSFKNHYKSIVVISGHNHANIYEEYNGIHYFTTTSTMNYPTEFRIFEVGEDYINVTMSGSVNTEIDAISQEIINGAAVSVPLLTLVGEGTDREIYIDLT